MGIRDTAAVAAGALGLSKVSAGCHKLLAETLPSYRPLLDRVTQRPTATVHQHWCLIASTVAYLGSLTYCATLGGAFDRDQLLMTSRSSIILLSDRGKPY